MTTADPPPVSGRRLASGLALRLMGAVGLALAPLAVLAYIQSDRYAVEAEHRSEQALIGMTLIASSPIEDAIRRAEGIAASTAVAVTEFAGDLPVCSAYMARLVEEETMLTFAGFVPADGNMVCSSNDRTLDFSQSPILAGLRADPRPVLNVNPQGPMSGEAVLIFSHPVYGPDRTFLGFVSMSLPHRAVTELPDTAERPLSISTFDDQGTILTSTLGITTVDQRLPVGHSLQDLAQDAPQVLIAEVQAGERRSFAVVPLVEGRLFALASWPLERRVITTFGYNLPLWVFPFGMWLASLGIAWAAAELQLLNYVRALSASMVAFSRGRRNVKPPRMTGAPAELREAGDAFEDMLDRFMRDEAEIAETLHQKEVLLREVHHRVKNNLQLIASIMNLQMRKAASPEAKRLLKGLHDRVMSLATVHRELYQTSGVVDIRADELLGKITTMVMRIGAAPGQSLGVETRFDDLRLTPDQSVPLSLILTEALTNVLKYASTGALVASPKVWVQLLRTDGGHARLEIGNTVVEQRAPQAADASDIESTGLGNQLLQAFAMQLGGMLEMEHTDERYVVAVDFPIRALDEAEENFAAG